MGEELRGVDFVVLTGASLLSPSQASTGQVILSARPSSMRRFSDPAGAKEGRYAKLVQRALEWAAPRRSDRERRDVVEGNRDIASEVRR